MVEVALHRPGEEPIRSPECVLQRLAIAVPKLFSEEPAPRRATRESRQLGTQRQVEPDDQLGAIEDSGAELRVVVTVHDPAARVVEELEHTLAELGGGSGGPVGTVMQSIELDLA